jgi:hypothetical protein
MTTDDVYKSADDLAAAHPGKNRFVESKIRQTLNETLVKKLGVLKKLGRASYLIVNIAEQPERPPRKVKLVSVKEGVDALLTRRVSKKQEGVRPPVKRPGSKGPLKNGMTESERGFARDVAASLFRDFRGLKQVTLDCFFRSVDGQPHIVRDSNGLEHLVAYFWAEIKLRKQPLTPEQERCIQEYRAAGLLVLVVEVDWDD